MRSWVKSYYRDMQPWQTVDRLAPLLQTAVSGQLQGRAWFPFTWGAGPINWYVAGFYWDETTKTWQAWEEHET